MTDHLTPSLSSCVIYDAAFDDGVFEELPSLLAQCVSARSATIAWSHLDGGTEILASSGYFSIEHYRNYTENYAADDIWVQAARPADRVNVALNLDEFVSDRETGGSRFFNEWIRGMGDDTFHCLGVSIAGEHGMGIIGLHRGRGGERFADTEVARIADAAPHLVRMLSIRGRLHAGMRATRRAEDMLDAVNVAVITVDASGRLVHANAEGQSVLARGNPLRVSGGQVCAAGGGAAAFATAVQAATHRRAPTASTILLPSHLEQVVATVVPFGPSGVRRQALVMIRSGGREASLTDQLRCAFDLSEAEARIALLIARGDSPGVIAVKRGTTPHTVRSQMKTLFGKMLCNSQAKVAATVAAMEATTFDETSRCQTIST